jgi:hypothetical protein
MASLRCEASQAPRRSRDCKLSALSLARLPSHPTNANTYHSEDGTIEGGRGAGLSAHKLGPKANQGAINAGLRALDRSGKPCRRWAKGSFTLKSFTGVVWEIPRWTAPPKTQPESSADDSTPASAEGSSKENKEMNGQLKSEISNNGADVEMQSAPSLAANSPAPLPIAAA